MNLDLLIFGKLSKWSQYLKIFGKHLQLKTASLLFVVNKFSKKLVNNKLVGHLEKFGFFLISSINDFRSSHSTVILTIILTGLVHWQSLKFGTLQSRSKFDQFLIGCIIFLSPFLDVLMMSAVSFLAQLDCGILCLQNAFPWLIIEMVLKVTMPSFLFWWLLLLYMKINAAIFEVIKENHSFFLRNSLGRKY